MNTHIHTEHEPSKYTGDGACGREKHLARRNARLRRLDLFQIHLKSIVGSDVGTCSAGTHSAKHMEQNNICTNRSCSCAWWVGLVLLVLSRSWVCSCKPKREGFCKCGGCARECAKRGRNQRKGARMRPPW